MKSKFPAFSKTEGKKQNIMRSIAYSIWIVFTMFWLEVNGQMKKTTQETSITINCFGTSCTDSFWVEIYQHFIPQMSPTDTKLFSKDKSNFFKVSIPNLKTPIYFSVFKDYNTHRRPVYILKMYLLSPGDNVTINLKEQGEHKIGTPVQYAITFSGKGAQKLNCQKEIFHALETVIGNRRLLDDSGNYLDSNIFQKCKETSREILDKYRSRIDNLSFNILEIDFYVMNEMRHINSLTNAMIYLDNISRAKQIIKQCKSKVDEEISHFNKDAKLISAWYPQLVVDKEAFGKLRGGNTNRIKEEAIIEVYEAIKQRYPNGEFKDKVLTFFALNNFLYKNGQIVFEKVLGNVRSNYCKKALLEFYDNNSIGRPAYDFSLPDTIGRLVSLRNFLGKVVFIDFWFNGCGACIEYYKNVVSKAEEHYKGNPEIVFVTVSIDSDKSKWLAGLNSNQYTSKDVINLYTGGKGMNHPIITKYRVTSYPRPLLIDKQGRIFNNNYDELKKGGAQKVIELIAEALKNQ